jgi:hypothetical protein
MIEVEDQTGHGGHFVLKELANGFTADTIEPILDHLSGNRVSLQGGAGVQLRRLW